MTYDPLEDYEQPEKPVFTETEVAALVEEMRAKCERIAKVFWLDYPLSHIADADVICGLCESIADAIAALRRPV